MPCERLNRKCYMTKTQIIAKAVLFAVGINAFNYLYKYSLTMFLSQIISFFEEFFPLTILILIVCLALHIGLFIFIFKKVAFYNNKFASYFQAQ